MQSWNDERIQLDISKYLLLDIVDIFKQLNKLLVFRGANTNVKAYDGLTPLHKAAMHGFNETVNLLVNRGSNINIQDNDLHEIQRWIFKIMQSWNDENNIPYTEDCLNHGAEVNYTDSYRMTPLHTAAMYGFTAIVDLLVFRGANTNVKAYDGLTPLHKAAMHGFNETVNLLVNRGSNINIQDNDGETPLHIAAWEGFKETVDLLIYHGANVNSQDNDGQTPLHQAAESGATEIAELLITHGAGVNFLDDEGYTPLHRAAIDGEMNTVKLLITRGTSVNSQDSKGHTPLHKAADSGSTEIADLLITSGADISRQDRQGCTPLHRAASGSTSEMVMMLIRKGADVNVKNKKGKTPYDQTENAEIKQILQNFKAHINAGLPFDLLQLDKKSAGIFTDLIKEESYDHFELRSMLHGEQSTGKSTIARFLVGKSPTRVRRSTDGIDLYTGLSFFDDETGEWIVGKHGFEMEDITVSRSVKSFLKQRPLLIQHVQKNTELPKQKNILSILPDKISNEIFEMSIEEKEGLILKTEGLAHPSQINVGVAKSETDLLKPMPPKFIRSEILERQETLLYERQVQDLEQEASLVPEDIAIEMYESENEYIILPQYTTKEISNKGVDIPQPKYEAMWKKQGLMHNSKDEEFESNIDKTLLKEEAMSNEQGLMYHSKYSEDPSGTTNVAAKEGPPKLEEQIEFEINKNPGLVGKLKSFFGVKKEVKKVKLSVTKSKFFNKSKDVAKKEFHKRKLVPVTIWDFGGQDVFYSTHQTFLTYRAVYMLVVDGSRTMNEPCRYEQFLPGKTGTKTQKDYVRFWINTIITYCKGDIPGFPKIMVILTHKDKIDVTQIEKRRREIFEEIEEMFNMSPIKQHLAIDDKIFVNARNSKDPEMEQIKKSLIHHARIQPTWGQKLPKCFLPLELEIQYLVKKGVTLIHIELMKKINAQQPVRSLTDSELKVFLKFQHSVGKILYFDEPYLDTHIIISPTYLIDAFKSIITDHQFCKRDMQKEKALQMMDNKGIIYKETVEALWKQRKYAHFLKNMRYLLRVMTHLDILVEPLRYDLKNNSRQPSEFYYVASMIRKQDTTGYLLSPTFCQRNIALCFDTSGFIIPPALSFRFISYCLSIWNVKKYGDESEDMLFQRSAVFTIDPSLDVHVQCEDEKIIVRLVHARNRTLIMKDLASSIRECLFAALHKISQLYIKTSSEYTDNIRSFDVKVCCSSSMEPCFIAIQDIGDVWICSRHQIEHGRDLVLSWIAEEGKDVCESLCPVTNEQFLLQTPTDLHFQRLTLEYSIEEVRHLVIQLGYPIIKWNKLYNSTSTEETIVFQALQKCQKLTNFTFKDLKSAAEKQDIQTPHTICKVLRDKHVSFDNEPEKWDLTPTEKDIDSLAPIVGDSSLAFLVELGLAFNKWETIKEEKDLVNKNRKIMEAWKVICKENNIRPTLRQIGHAFQNIGIHIKNIENVLFV